MKTLNLIVLSLLSVVVLACTESDADIANGDDPLRALTVPHRSERYGSPYWTQKSISDAELWAKALAYCEGRIGADFPNCDTVRYVDMMDRASRFPEQRPDTFRLTVPSRGRDTTPDSR